MQYDNNIAEIAGVKKNFEDNIPAETDVFFALGNHDSSNGSHAADFYDGLGSRFYKGELNPDARTSGNRHAVIGGYNFISVEASYAPEMISADNLKFLNDTLQSIVTDPSYDGRYIFVVCHVSPPNTVFGASPINDIDSVLKNYSQAILLSGHSHYPINDERSIMQTNYTTLGLGSVSYMAMPKGYLETNADELVSDSYSLSMGTMIQIDNNGNIKITRIDFTQNKQIKSAWYLAAPKLDETHMCSYPKERGTTFAIAPVMPQAAAINAVYTAGNTVRVTFTPATDDDMVFSYGVQFFDDGAAQPYASYYSLSPFYRYPDLSLMPTADITVTIGSVTKLPHTVKVFAQDSYGTKSGDISCTAVKSDNTNTVTKDVLIINPNTETYSLDAIYELSLKEDFSQLLDNVGILSAHIGKDLYLRTKATASHNVGAAIKFIPDSYTVTLPQSDKFTITPDKAEKLTYLKGADFKFLLSFAAGYENYNAIVKANDIALNKTDNKYSVAVSGAVAITVDLTIQSFSITLPTVIGATVEQITDSTTVNKGDDYKFRLTLAEDYNLSTVVVKVNDVILTAVDGVYTVENVTQNITITLEGVTKNPAIEPPTTTKKGCSAANAAALLSGLLALALVVLKIKR